MRIHIIIAMSLALALSACDFGGDSVDSRVADARKRYDGPAIWSVSDVDSTVYLFGSVHLLPKDLDWQRRDLEDSFASVGTVFFEDPQGPQAELKRSIAQREKGLYATGQRLRDHLDQRQLNRLTAAAHNADISMDALDGFKPWLASDFLIVGAADAAGLSPEYSADTVLRARAKAMRKQVRYLDAPDTYINAVADLPEWVQMEAFEETIRNLDSLETETRALNAAWVAGQIERIEHDMIAPTREKFPQLYETLFAKRNAQWAALLDEFLQGDTDALVVAGIGHMLGDDGLPSRLRERGYDVKRVRRFDLPNDLE